MFGLQDRLLASWRADAGRQPPGTDRHGPSRRRLPGRRRDRKGPGDRSVGWLLVAAVALMLLAGWCASAETALLRVSRAGAKELGRSAGEAAEPLQAVLAECPVTSPSCCWPESPPRSARPSWSPPSCCTGRV